MEKIKEIRIEKLFGQFTHHIKWEENSNIRFIYGTNGIGKTTILQILSHLFPLNVSNIQEVLSIHFSKIEVTFSNNSILTIKRKGYYACSVILQIEEEKHEWEYNDEYYQSSEYKNLMYEFIEIIREKTPFKPNGMNLFSTPSGQIYSPIALAENYPSYFLTAERSKILGIPEIILQKSANNLVYFIPIHRSNETQLEIYLKKFSQMLIDKQNEYNQTSNQLKSSQRKRLKEGKFTLKWAKEILAEKGTKLKIKIEALQSVGLLWDINVEDELALPLGEDTLENDLFSILLQDLETQLTVFEKDKFAEKVLLFHEILNEYFMDKEVIFDTHLHLEDVVKFETSSLVSEIPFYKLSSGEKQEFILWYLMLFEIPENALILIDEPEISLHIDWQMDFLPRLQRLIELRNVYFLIATHSPSIINGHFELAKSLNEDDEETQI